MAIIEKMAKAISGQDEAGWNGLPEDDRQRLYGGGKWHENGNTRDDWRECARAALAVLLEPTDNMVDAGFEINDGPFETNIVFKAMIQAALDEK